MICTPRTGPLMPEAHNNPHSPKQHSTTADNTSTTAQPVSCHSYSPASLVSEPQSRRIQAEEEITDTITISTQNCGGMRGEYHRKHGPKISTLRKLLSIKNTDFLVLTEVRAEEHKKKNIRLKWGLQESISSLHLEAKAGVILYSNGGHQLIEDSTRFGSIPGHLCMGVYEKDRKKIIVVAYYGPSENNDRLSAQMMQEMYDNIRSLQHTYNTMKVIIAGDFNVVWREKDSNSFHTRKPQTTRIFQQLMEDYDLTDLGLLKGAKHTWYRKGRDYQSSRIDYVLTNLQLDGPTSMKPQVTTRFTIFDHVYLQATFGLEVTKRKPAMKDYILGSEEYIIIAENIIRRIIQQQGILKPDWREEVSEEEGNDTMPSLESQYQFNHRHTGENAMTTLNCIIGELDQLHSNILARKNAHSSRQLQNTSKQIYQLQARLKTEKEQQERENISQEISRCQKELANDLEAKNQATQMRIKNFYLAGNGRMVPQSFYIIKEKQGNRTIRFLEVNNQEITDPAEIVKIMQEWYEKKAQEETIQTMALLDFLSQRGIQLPQLTEDQKLEMEQEFTEQEVKDALSEAAEASAPGPSGHSIVFYKLLFLEIPSLFTEALNQMVFVPKLSNEDTLKWIHNRKIIYIPKKLKPTTPADYRPLSLLEVLYKIPSRILSKRITKVLPTVIGAHQHGFMAQKGIQEPSILVTHLIQDANRYGKPLQLISFDIEKAFDKVSHRIILQALEAFGFPPIYIEAIREYILIGHAYVEVNGQVGMYISIRTGSGQGDPMSSSLFLIASEPVNLAITKICQQIMYTDRMGNQPNAILFADDNINQRPSRMRKIYSLCLAYMQTTKR